MTSSICTPQRAHVPTTRPGFVQVAGNRSQRLRSWPSAAIFSVRVAPQAEHL